MFFVCQHFLLVFYQLMVMIFTNVMVLVDYVALFLFNWSHIGYDFGKINVVLHLSYRMDA